MLKGKKSLLILIAAANVVLVAGILYGVSTTTFNLNINDSGGNPALCNGSATHSFSAGAHGYYYSYSTGVHHNGEYVGSDYHSGNGTGPNSWNGYSFKSGTATYVDTQHNTNGSHGSYIENSSDPDDSASDTKGSSTGRQSD